MWASLALSPSVFAAHCADQFSSLLIVGRESRVGGVRRIERRIERDHQNSSLARPFDRGNDRLGVAWRDQDRLRAGVHQAARWRPPGPSLSPSYLPAKLRKSTPSSFAFACRAFLHFREEWIGVRFRDQPDNDLLLGEGRSGRKRPCGDSAGGDCLPTRAALVTERSWSYFPPLGFAVVARFVSDDDQPDEAMSWMGRWQTRISLRCSRVNCAERITHQRVGLTLPDLLATAPHTLTLPLSEDAY